MRTLLLAAAASVALSACGFKGQDNASGDETSQTASTDSGYGYETYGEDNLADAMASNDDRYMRANAGADGASGLGENDVDIPDPEQRPMMQAQVVLDRVGFGPGVIDGKMGMSTENALRGFQEANNLEVTGELDEATKQALSQWERIPATRVVTIPASWSSIKYQEMPEDPADIAKMDRMSYASLDEKLAERFHTTVEVLKQLNPNGVPAGMDQANASATPAATASATPSPTPTGTATGETRTAAATTSFFKPGQQIRVPNIGGDRIAPGAIEDRGWQQTLASLGVGTEQPEVDRIVVSKAGKTLKAYQGDKLVALFTVSSGSSRFPLPLGEWDIVGQAHNPTYAYNPEVLGKLGTDGEKFQFAPGPNSPVGVVWIDLSKEHYGIHGTPDPSTIGRAQSSGCVRLTNWDAARLSGMVSQSTEVIFEA